MKKERKEIAIWLTGGVVNGKPIPGVTFHCKLKDADEALKYSIDVPKEIYSHLENNDESTKKAFEYGISATVGDLELRMLDALDKLYER